MLSAIGSVLMVLLFMFVPMGNTALLFAGVPLNIMMLMKFPPMGPFMTELYPDRGARQRAGLLLQCRPRDRRVVPDAWSGVLSETHAARRGHRGVQRRSPSG